MSNTVENVIKVSELLSVTNQNIVNIK